jgi:RHS repeat-associated protein
MITVVENTNQYSSQMRKYYYDGSHIIAELDGNNNLLASYTHSPLAADDILGAKLTSDAVSAGLSSAQGYVYYLKDHLGSVNEVVNANGSIIQKMEFGAFGQLRSVKNSQDVEVSFESAPVRTSFTYTGREFEPELGMYYYRARYYDPSVGRFLQQDPDPGKLNNPITFLSKYIYGANNPIMFTDPSGRFIQVLIGAIIGAAVGAVIGAIDGLVNGGNFLEKVLKGAIGGALFGAAFAINPLAAGLSLGVSLIKAGGSSGNFFENLNNNLVSDGAFAVVSSFIAYNNSELLATPGLGVLFNGLVDLAGYGGIIFTVISIKNTLCDKDKGSYVGSDLCLAH